MVKLKLKTIRSGYGGKSTPYQSQVKQSGEASAHDFIRAQNRNRFVGVCADQLQSPARFVCFCTFDCAHVSLSFALSVFVACNPLRKASQKQPPSNRSALLQSRSSIAQPVGDGNARHLLTNRRPVASVPRVGVFAAFDYTPCGPCLADRGQAEKRSREWGTRPDREANLRSRE